jgi:hypothetical protein
MKPGVGVFPVLGCGLGIAAAIAMSGLAFLLAAGRLGGPRLEEGREALEKQRQGLAEQQQRLDAERRRLRDERVALRKERMLLLADRFREGERRGHSRVLLRNTCSYAVAVALRYRDLDDAWIVRGWWEVAPKGEVTTDAMTRHREIHFYAENQGVGRTWDGTGTEGARSLSITDSRFDWLEDERFDYDAPRSVSFYRREAPEGLADHVEVFECLAEAPPQASAPPPSKGEAQGEATRR